MADQVLTYKYVVKNVARAAGKSVTFMPKPIFGDNGSGMHTHQSLWKEGTPLMADKSGYAGLSQLARAYIGGLLAHAPALLAFCAPTTNSYRRLVPGYEAPVNLVYSQRNRSACIRIPMYSDSPKAKRIEFRCPDAAANPYLAFAAMLMAGLDGIEQGLDAGEPADYDLFEEDRGVTQVPGLARRGARRARGRPRVPDRGRRLQRGADPDVDRLQARARGRRRAAPPAPGRVLPLLRRVIAAPSLTIEALTAGDWPAVSAIYADGIATRNATFETEVPSWEAWDAAHLSEHRLVARDESGVLGWAALSAYSDRCAYAGVAEVSVYVAKEAQRSRRRPRAPEALIESSEAAGIWTLQAGVFPENLASLRLHSRVRVPRRRRARADRTAGRTVAGRRPARATKQGDRLMIKVEAVVIRERVETVIDAVEEETGHVGVTVVEAIGHGRQRGITHEYRGRVFESRFLPKAVLTFVVPDELADAVVAAISDAARSGNESGDGLVWTSPVDNVTHNRTGSSLEEVEVG